MVDALFPPEFFRALERCSRARALPGAGRAAAARRGSTSPGFERARYATGDALAAVDWRASARRDTLLVRLREEERGGELCLVLDRSASLQPGQPRRDQDQRRLALALGWLRLEAGGSVRLHAGSPPLQFSGFERRSALQEALRALPAPQGSDAPPAAAAARGARRVLVLTDPWCGEPTWSFLATAARRCAQTACVSLILPEEDTPPQAALDVTAVEGGGSLRADLDAGREAYARRWEAWLAQRRARAAACGARLVEVRCGRAGASAAHILETAGRAGLV
ncbi:MAG: DUF58 domain-containing protein [Planctomycetota bacterium]|nr:MAG: DUF58 domain-containing protein [Planctomycetota bacterium]